MKVKLLADELDLNLPETPFVFTGGSLLLMVGLPGSGKSSIVENLRHSCPFVLISTDGIRTLLSSRPIYTPSEMSLVYEIGYELITRRLKQGQRVVFDASNHLAARREHVIRLAEQCGAPAAVCIVQAAQEMIQQRLRQRTMGHRRQGDLSDAYWSVYKWMVEMQEPIAGPHLILDTTSTPPEPLAAQLYQYWTDIEANAAGRPYLQSPRWAYKLGNYH